jgi:hypothetical protein
VTWFQPLLIAFIAGCAAWVALQQWVVARLKLNHDLFERRFAVYTATQEYLVACLNRSGGTHEDTGAFYQATRAAPFLFEKDVNEFLALLMRHSVDIQVFSKHVDMSHLPDWQKHIEILHTSEQWAGEHFGKLSSIFRPSLNVSEVIPFPLRKIISIPDPQALRDKITASLQRKPGDH